MTHRLLRVALVSFGAVMMLLYPISVVWPAGWSWHDGAPYESHYFMMIVGFYITLGAFVVGAARDPGAHLSLIRFAIWSSAVHATIMFVQSVAHDGHRGHLVGDVPALLFVAVVLTVLVRRADLTGTGAAPRAGSRRPALRSRLPAGPAGPA